MGKCRAGHTYKEGAVFACYGSRQVYLRVFFDDYQYLNNVKIIIVFGLLFSKGLGKLETYASFCTFMQVFFHDHL